ncbi:DUF2934 domain-containing protein [Rhizobium sp. SYY.PMSO]|uniref:DUF2934 domain-containing protein n=1 Tax=Rhizobium sp. SYY.PMSO TaxID=3382192 RepID=UPI0039900E34
MIDNEDENDGKRRERAYRIWEEEGRPEGRHLDHWQRAEEQHEHTEQEVNSSNGPESDNSPAHDHQQKKAAPAKTPRPVRK